MRDVSTKPNTLRSAKASAVLHCSHETIQAIQSGNVPKADPVGVAKVAGIQAAKNTSLLIPYCHNVPIDFVGIQVDMNESSISVNVEVKAVWKTGVEMEALTAAAAVVLTLYDMLKIIDETMSIGEIRLREKRGGKSDFKSGAAGSLRSAVLVLSDSAADGKREDKSGIAVRERLSALGVEISGYKVLHDDEKEIRDELVRLCDHEGVDLVITAGGTGLSSRDVTPESTEPLLDRRLPGVEERIRSFGQERNRYAMLSRSIAGVRGNTIIVNLPGSLNAVNESMEVLFPWLLHSFDMMRGGGH